MGIFQFIGLTVQVIQWYKKNAIFLEGENMNSFTEFASLERLTFYTFVSVTNYRTIFSWSNRFVSGSHKFDLFSHLNVIKMHV